MKDLVLWYQKYPWMVILTAYVVMSFVVFIAYAIDKRAARQGRWRTPESTLHMLEFLCGWPGGWLAQRWLRHKSVKTSFRVVFFLMVALNLAAFAFVVYWIRRA